MLAPFFMNSVARPAMLTSLSQREKTLSRSFDNDGDSDLNSCSEIAPCCFIYLIVVLLPYAQTRSVAPDFNFPYTFFGVKQKGSVIKHLSFLAKEVMS